MKTGVVLISHGYMAKETLKSAQMIIGKVNNAFSLAMLSDDSPETIKDKLKDLLYTLKSYNKVIVFADLLGGTPSNTVLQELKNEKKITLVTGFNLGIIIETLTIINSNSDININNIIQSGKSNIVNVNEKIKNASL